MADWKAYAKQRESLGYYQVIRRYITRHSPGASILEIGPGGTGIVMSGDFATRSVVNREPLPVDSYPGVEVAIGEWPAVDIAKRSFDLVVCCHTKPSIYQCDRFGEPCLAAKVVSGPMLVILAGEPKPKAMHVRDCRTCPDRVDP
jgi:hypothetical protein